MDSKAIRTIQIHNFKLPRAEAVEKAQVFLDTLAKLAPIEHASNTNPQYYVMPGYEHVTKHQPIAMLNQDGEWELSTTNLFVQP